MKLIDLTYPMEETYKDKPAAVPSIIPITVRGQSFKGVIYDFNWGSMMGSYIDFPGHIKETDDGIDADNAPLEDLYEIPAAVIHLSRQGAPGPIRAEELEEASVDVPEDGALIIHALGRKRFNEVEADTVFFGKSAIEWIVKKRIKLIVSDVYENHKNPEGVFVELFKAGIATVCLPINLEKITKNPVKLSALCMRAEGVTQLPCRVLVRED